SNRPPVRRVASSWSRLRAEGSWTKWTLGASGLECQPWRKTAGRCMASPLTISTQIGVTSVARVINLASLSESLEGQSITNACCGTQATAAASLIYTDAVRRPNSIRFGVPKTPDCISCQEIIWRYDSATVERRRRILQQLVSASG